MTIMSLAVSCVPLIQISTAGGLISSPGRVAPIASLPHVTEYLVITFIILINQYAIVSPGRSPSSFMPEISARTHNPAFFLLISF